MARLYTNRCHTPTCAAQARTEEVAEIRRRATLWRAPETLILDTETTDLDGYVVQIAVINTGGVALLNTLINPGVPISEEAQRVHGITADQVQTAPPFADVLDALRSLLAGRRVVVYNAAFDYGILANELDRVAADDSARQQELAHWLRGVRWCCAKELYAAWWGDWSAYHGDYRWQPLPGGDHSALGDCRATLALLAHIAEGERHSEH